jgi:hypothetical protein
MDKPTPLGPHKKREEIGFSVAPPNFIQISASLHQKKRKELLPGVVTICFKCPKRPQKKREEIDTVMASAFPLKSRGHVTENREENVVGYVNGVESAVI